MNNLTAEDLVRLIRSVFPPRPGDRRLAILVDVPRRSEDDTEPWRRRRALAAEWAASLQDRTGELGLDGVDLVAYPDVGSNNADLPAEGFRVTGPLSELAEGLAGVGEKVPFEQVFGGSHLLFAPTEYSTTAPLKVAARRHGFRAATMPGFSSDMIPALRLDYDEINRRVMLLKERLDRAVWAEVKFRVDGEEADRMLFDLRQRSAHASSGRFPEPGIAGNLPSGEAYIVPFEGTEEEASTTAGTLPVQIGDELVRFTIEANQAVAVHGDGPEAAREADHLQREPAYGNMAELGFGVLADFGVTPIGRVLLDEKLGFHVAFGRSDHFGGKVGPGDFSGPKAVIHLDRIYIPATQPRVGVASLVLGYPDETTETIMSDGQYTLFG